VSNNGMTVKSGLWVIQGHWKSLEIGHWKWNHAIDHVRVSIAFSSNYGPVLYPGWPLVWKTSKCQGIWQLSGKCQWFY